jgi:hypothetical protein
MREGEELPGAAKMCQKLGEGRGCRDLARAANKWQNLGGSQGCREVPENVGLRGGERLPLAARKWQRLEGGAEGAVGSCQKLHENGGNVGIGRAARSYC